MNNDFLVEGGAVGHLQHLYDNPSLTFGEIKDVIKAAASGKLEKVSEKMDGMNLVFTFDVSTNELKVARSGGDIKRGGMDASALAKKFQGRNMEPAFNSAFQVLNDAISSLPQSVQKKIFGPRGNRWYSIEIIYTGNPNVINYDSNNIVFHGWPVFEVKRDGTVVQSDNDTGIKLLSSRINEMQKSVSLKDWKVNGPSLLSMKKLSDGSIASSAQSKISSAMASAGVSDSNTLYEYLRNLMSNEVAKLGLPEDVAAMVVERAVDVPGAPGIPEIKRNSPREFHAPIAEFIKNAEPLKKAMIFPLEDAIGDFAVEVLRGLNSTLISSSGEEVERLQAQVRKAIAAIESSGNQAAMDVLKREMSRLKAVENISSPMEGVVFFYKGQPYKFTGGFAPVNQILGLFKYGRKGIPAMSTESVTKSRQEDKLLRETIKLILEDDERISARLDSEEKSAKAAYDAAVSELQKWDEENAKRLALLDKAESLGIKIGDNKASKDLRKQPAFNYDPKVLQKKRENLVAAVDKTRDLLGAYDPRITNFKRAQKDVKTTPAAMPDGSEKVYMPIGQVKPTIWYSWADPRWAKAIKNVPYGSSKDKTGDETVGVGPGEERLAIIFGGKVQGPSVSFDLVTPDERRWEVKALETASTLLRPGTEGTAALAKPMKRLISICKQLSLFSKVVQRLGPELVAMDDEDLATFQYIKDFVDNDIEVITRGELSTEKFKLIRAILKATIALKQKWHVKKKPDSSYTIGLGDKDIAVDKPTFIDVAKRVQKASPDEDVLSSFEERELAVSPLKDSAFENVNSFFDEWFDSVDIERVFSQVDGVFIVNTSGFNMIPRQLFKKAFKFEVISQMKPKFSYTMYNS